MIKNGITELMERNKKLQAINAELLAACRGSIAIEDLWWNPNPVDSDESGEYAALAAMHNALMSAIAKATESEVSDG